MVRCSLSIKEEADLNARAQAVIDRKKRKKRDRDGKGKDKGRDGRDNKRKKVHPSQGDAQPVRSNLGRKHKLNPNRLMGLVNERIKGKKPDFGEIRIEATSTTFDVESKSVPAVIASLTGASFEGRSVKARTV